MQNAGGVMSPRTFGGLRRRHGAKPSFDPRPTGRCGGREGDVLHTAFFIRKQLGDGEVPTSTPFDTLSLPLSAVLLKQVAVRVPPPPTRA